MRGVHPQERLLYEAFQGRGVKYHQPPSENMAPLPFFLEMEEEVSCGAAVPSVPLHLLLISWSHTESTGLRLPDSSKLPYLLII